MQKQAAVLILLSRERGEESVLLTERSDHLRHHPGEISFPGGMSEPFDEDLFDTAAREANEEVGVLRDHLDVIGGLRRNFTIKGVSVTPFAARMKQASDYLSANDGEIQSMMWIPTRFFLQDIRVQTDIFNYKGVEYWSPVYRYGHYRIWGLTARIMVQFMNTYLSARIVRSHTSQELMRF